MCFDYDKEIDVGGTSKYPEYDDTTNPRMELAFREPSKRITKNNKIATRGEALDTIHLSIR